MNKHQNYRLIQKREKGTSAEEQKFTYQFGWVTYHKSGEITDVQELESILILPDSKESLVERINKLSLALQLPVIQIAN
jgi:hypothetical protein